jgi:hypothetical protein
VFGFSTASIGVFGFSKITRSSARPVISVVRFSLAGVDHWSGVSSFSWLPFSEYSPSGTLVREWLLRYFTGKDLFARKGR